MSVTASDRISVQGHVSRGFEAVRQAFVENFAQRRELGGACCAYHHGEKVVDLWGGVRNKLSAEVWERGTMVVASAKVIPLQTHLVRLLSCFSSLSVDGSNLSSMGASPILHLRAVRSMAHSRD